jgi:arsenate reductase
MRSAEVEPDKPGRLERAVAEQIARNLRAMADPTRVQILSLIVEAAGGRRPVTELADELRLTQPTVSHHLRIMAEEGLLERTQEGRQAWYSVVPARVSDVLDSVRADPVASVVAPPVLDRIAADLTIRFAGVFSPETIAEYVRGSYLLLAERARITRYLPSLTARFASDRLRALAQADGLSDDAIPEVLFVCVRNAGRSQLASAILRSLAGDRVRVLTAGSEPAGAISPKIVAALDEIGVSIGGEYPKPLTDEVVRAADYVVTMGCGDACPIYPGRRYLDWELADPADLPMDAVRAIRDDIDGRVRALLAEIDSVNVR